MNVNLTFELSMVLDQENFYKVLNRMDNLEETEEGYMDQSFSEKGILVKYRNSQYKKRVRLIVHPGPAPDSGGHDPDKLLQKLDKRIRRYFEDMYQMEDFELSGVTITTDINVSSREHVFSYLKALHRIGRVKGFSPSSYEYFEEGAGFSLDGNSSGIVFLIYDLERIAVGHLKEWNASKKKLKKAGRDLEGVLRSEVRLTKAKTVRNYTGAVNIRGQITALSENARDIFLDTFTKVIPYGDFYKKDRAAELVREEMEDRTLRRKMLRLLDLIPKKKSLYLAQKSMNCRDVDKIMDAFARICVSPVTISRRQDVKHLKNIYDYVLA